MAGSGPDNDYDPRGTDLIARFVVGGRAVFTRAVLTGESPDLRIDGERWTKIVMRVGISLCELVATRHL